MRDYMDRMTRRARNKELISEAEMNQMAQVDTSGSLRPRGFFRRFLSFLGLSLKSKPRSKTGFDDFNRPPISRLRDRWR